MTSPSPANSTDAGAKVRPHVEKGATGRSATHAVVDGEVAPRLPHERDESSDSGTREPSQLMHKAADDLKNGQTDVPKGPETQRRYSDLTEQAGTDAKPDQNAPD